MLNTPRGSQSSAILYSIAETAKANNLKPYEYFRFLLDEIAEHLYGREHDPNDRAFLNDLLPWSDKLPDVCKKKIWSLLEPGLAPVLFLLDGCGWAVTYTALPPEKQKNACTAPSKEDETGRALLGLDDVILFENLLDILDAHIFLTSTPVKPVL